MWLSKKHKFLFIHIQKTGGTSIANALRNQVKDLRPVLGPHDQACLAKSKLNINWPDYYKVAFVRNPWERLVSWYVMINHIGSNVSLFRRIFRTPYGYNRIVEYVMKNSNSFEEFLYSCTDTIEDFDGKKSFLYNQLDYVSDPISGEIIVDFIGRYEQLEMDAKRIFERLDLTAVKLPHLNQTIHKHYRDYYSTETRKLVEQRFLRDIEHFGYEF